MNCVVRNSTGLTMTKKLLGGQMVSFVRNAGGGHGPSLAPGSRSIPIPPGPKQIQQMKNWVSTAAIFGAAGFGGLCYFTDWRVVCDWIPFYSGKYK